MFTEIIQKQRTKGKQRENTETVLKGKKYIFWYYVYKESTGRAKTNKQCLDQTNDS